MAKAKLSKEDFYHQFHGHEHHNDPGDHVKPRWYEIPKKLRKAHKPFDFHMHAATKGQKKVVIIAKNVHEMRRELMKHKDK